MLETGDAVCADGRVVESCSLKTEESALTGEALPVEKTAAGGLPAETATGDRKNMVLVGGYVVYGKGKVLVTATGMDTEMGRIAAMLSHTSDSMTPLQKKLEQTGKQLGIGALAICALIFCMGILQEKPPFSMFMTAVSLAVAAIPEGLPAIVTIVLAMGTSRMSEKHTIVRRLSAVETLGGAQVICSDKTGTLTQNRMQVTTWTDYSHREPKMRICVKQWQIFLPSAMTAMCPMEICRENLRKKLLGNMPKAWVSTLPPSGGTCRGWEKFLFLRQESA